MQGQIINGFELKRLLGVGGMSEVWYAENEIGKPAAVKILNQNLSSNPQIVERFHNEALVMVKLSHFNIRQVYSYGYIGNHHCIVMEYLEGDDLSDLMKAGRRFSQDELQLWWNQIVSALNYTHKQGIVHRDIKPSNLFLDQEGNIKLLDFGIAKIMENSSLTQTGSMMGTLMYMSPEQVKDSKTIDYHTDIYSLAVTFVNLLTGKKPYDVDTTSDFEIRERIVYTPLDLSVLPAEWQVFLAPYLAKEPQDRPELRRFEQTSNAPIHQEVVAPQQAPKKKSKAGLFIGLGVGVIVIAAAIVALVLLMKPKEEPPQIDHGFDAQPAVETSIKSEPVQKPKEAAVAPKQERKDIVQQDSVKKEPAKPHVQNTPKTTKKSTPLGTQKKEASKTTSKPKSQEVKKLKPKKVDNTNSKKDNKDNIKKVKVKKK
jgi:serine/threonine protein kinase